MLNDCPAPDQFDPGEIDYEYVTDSDVDEISALFAKVFGRELSADYYRWQFMQAPTGGAHSAVARYKGRIVSHVGYSLREALTNGTRGRFALKFTSMSDPAHQGQGIYTALMGWAHSRLREKEVDFVLSWPNVRNHPSQRNRTDFEDLWQIPTLKWSPPMGGSRAEIPVPFPTVSEVNLDVWGSLALHTPGAASYGLLRSREHLNWRYASAPHTVYYAVESYQAGRLVTALVFKLYPAGRPDRINIVDWFCQPEDRSGAAALALLEDYAAKVGLSVTLWHNVHDYPRHHLLERRGYRPSEPVFYFGVFPLAPRERLGNYRDWRQWYVAMGDVDIF